MQQIKSEFTKSYDTSLAENSTWRHFDAWWQMPLEWHEPPNIRRGGYSGVGQAVMPLSEVNKTDVFVKRQENHVHRAWWLLGRKIPTLAREMRNIERLQQEQIPTLTPIFYGVRKHTGRWQGVLVTQTLQDYVPLADCLEVWAKEGWPMRAYRNHLLQATANVVRRLHRAHLQHNCLYPKHLFVHTNCLNPHALMFDDGYLPTVYVIDLEKTKWRLFRKWCWQRDLDTLNRHTSMLSRKDKLRFLKYYLEVPTFTREARRMIKRIEQLSAKKPA